MNRTARWGERLRSILLRTALGFYNAVIFIVLHVVAWRNSLWDERRWTPKSDARGS